MNDPRARLTLADRRIVWGLVLTAAVLSVPMLLEPWALPITIDADAFNCLSHVAVLHDAVRRVGEYPVWNPYFGGGFPWAGSVYNPGISPQSILFIAFGEVLGIKLWAVCVLALGSVGLYLAAREWLALSPAASTVGALLYATAPWMGGVLDGGDYDLLGMYALPFMLFAFGRLLTGRRLGWLTPLCLWSAFADAAKWWPFIVAAAVLLLALACRDGLPGPRPAAGRILSRWCAVVVVGVLISAPKLLPLTRLMALDRVPQMAEREWDLCYTSFRELLQYVLTTEGHGNLTIAIGWPGLVLTLAALARRRTLWPVAALAALLAVVAMGPHAPIPVVDLASHVPILRNMGSYGMYLSLPILVCLVLLATVGVDVALLEARRWPDRRLALGVLACAAAFVLTGRAVDQLDTFAGLFGEPPPPVARQPFTQVAYGPLVGVVARYRETPARIAAADQYRNLLRGIGTTTWLGNMVFPEQAEPAILVDDTGRSRPSPRYRGEAVAADAGAGVSLGTVTRTYNTLRLWLETSRPATIVLNTNCIDGWTSTAGRTTCRDGRLAIDLPHPTSGTVLLAFRDRTFAAGCLVALLAAAAWLAGVRRWTAVAAQEGPR